jgi:hypothetical protein
MSERGVLRFLAALGLVFAGMGIVAAGALGALRPAESAPEFTKTCTPDSDANIKDSADPNSPAFIGRHSGGAFMEMQFYPPGWASWPAGVSCSPTKWCAALNIDSFNQAESPAGDVDNNLACLDSVSEEPVNFAYLTSNGVAHAPAGPIDGLTNTALARRAVRCDDRCWLRRAATGRRLLSDVHDCRNEDLRLAQNLSGNGSGIERPTSCLTRDDLSNPPSARSPADVANPHPQCPDEERLKRPDGL